jgi:hypothetical protein
MSHIALLSSRRVFGFFFFLVLARWAEGRSEVISTAFTARPHTFTGTVYGNLLVVAFSTTANDEWTQECRIVADEHGKRSIKNVSRVVLA